MRSPGVCSFRGRCGLISTSEERDLRPPALPLRVIIVRHGRTGHNREGLYRGLLDVPLDQTGLAQADLTARFLIDRLGVARHTTRAIYTSRLSRAAATAAPLAQALGLPVEVEPGLLDVDVGRWEGLSVVEVQRNEPDVYGSWVADPASFRYPGGESLASVHARCAALLSRLETAASAGGDHLLFTHRVTAKLLVAAALGLGPELFWRVQVDNASVTVLHRDSRGFVLTLLNATDHLQ